MTSYKQVLSVGLVMLAAGYAACSSDSDSDSNTGSGGQTATGGASSTTGGSSSTTGGSSATTGGSSTATGGSDMGGGGPGEGGGGGDSAECPMPAPDNGDECDDNGTFCSYETLQCFCIGFQNAEWQCSEPDPACPESAPDDETSCEDVDTGTNCAYPDGTLCRCGGFGGNNTEWTCFGGPGGMN